MDEQRLLEDVGNVLARVECRIRVLEHGLDLATESLQLRPIHGEDVPAAVAHAAAGRLDESQHSPGERRLARAALSHDAEDLALSDRE